MPSVSFRLAALLLVATTAFATPYPTNMDLLVETVSSAVDAGLADMLFDENGHPRPSILVFKGEDQVRWDDTTIRVEDGETITLLSPVSGG